MLPNKTYYLFIIVRAINRANNSIFSRRFSGYLPFVVSARPKWPFVRRERANWLWSVPIPRRVMPQDRSTLLAARALFNRLSRKESQKFTFYAARALGQPANWSLECELNLRCAQMAPNQPRARTHSLDESN